MIEHIQHDHISESLDKLYGNVILVPFLSNPSVHYSKTDISAIYVYSIDSGHEYIFNFNNISNGKYASIDDLKKLINCTIIAFNAKYIQHLFLPVIYDLNTLLWYNGYDCIDISPDIQPLETHFKNLYSFDDTNRLIPIQRLVGIGRKVQKSFCKAFGSLQSDFFSVGYELYSYRNSVLLNEIERSGIGRADGITFYGEYNPYTITGRPVFSSPYGNPIAYPKHGDKRKEIVSKYNDGRLIEIDYSAYHLHIIAELIGWKFPTADVHTYLAKLYYPGAIITEARYIEAKRKTFSLIYSENLEDYKHIEFFNKLHTTLLQLESEWKSSNIVSHPKVHKTYIYDPNNRRGKYLNYLIQAYESERNVAVLANILEYLYERSSDLILYGYDSFVLDIHPDDMELLVDIIELLKCDEYPVRIKFGTSYGNMIDLKLRDKY
jgi:hypothetical protein